MMKKKTYFIGNSLQYIGYYKRVELLNFGLDIGKIFARTIFFCDNFVANLIYDFAPIFGQFVNFAEVFGVGVAD